MAKDQHKSSIENFVDEIIDRINEGVMPWQKSWEPGEMRLPFNPATGMRYHGSNLTKLMMFGFSDPRFLTYQQANRMGYQVRAGSKGIKISFFSSAYISGWMEDIGIEGARNEIKGLPGPVESIVEDEKQIERPVYKEYVVFNASQIEGFPPLSKEPPAWDSIEEAEKILQNSGAVIIHDRKDNAYYDIQADEIHLPPKDQFPTAYDYYSTALHELGHWTGHPSRLNRPNLGFPFGSQNYAREELCAEMASMLVSTEIGLGFDPGNHDSYVAGWVSVLQSDPREIQIAARDAERVMNYVVTLQNRQEQDIQKTLTGFSGEERQTRILDYIKCNGAVNEVAEPMLANMNTIAPRTYLTVTKNQKDVVKALGAVWDKEQGAWYVPQHIDVALFKQWNPREVIPTVIYLNVPKEEKDKVKALGAKWNPTKKQWYVPSASGVDISLFNRWNDAVDDAGVPEPEPGLSEKVEACASELLPEAVTLGELVQEARRDVAEGRPIALARPLHDMEMRLYKETLPLDVDPYSIQVNFDDKEHVYRVSYETSNSDEGRKNLEQTFFVEETAKMMAANVALSYSMCVQNPYDRTKIMAETLLEYAYWNGTGDMQERLEILLHLAEKEMNAHILEEQRNAPINTEMDDLLADIADSSESVIDKEVERETARFYSFTKDLKDAISSLRALDNALTDEGQTPLDATRIEQVVDAGLYKDLFDDAAQKTKDYLGVEFPVGMQAGWSEVRPKVTDGNLNPEYEVWIVREFEREPEPLPMVFSSKDSALAFEEKINMLNAMGKSSQAERTYLTANYLAAFHLGEQGLEMLEKSRTEYLAMREQQRNQVLSNLAQGQEVNRYYVDMLSLNVRRTMSQEDRDFSLQLALLDSRRHHQGGVLKRDGIDLVDYQRLQRRSQAVLGFEYPMGMTHTEIRPVPTNEPGLTPIYQLVAYSPYAEGSSIPGTRIADGGVVLPVEFSSYEKAQEMKTRLDKIAAYAQPVREIKGKMLSDVLGPVDEIRGDLHGKVKDCAIIAQAVYHRWSQQETNHRALMQMQWPEMLAKAKETLSPEQMSISDALSIVHRTNPDATEMELATRQFQERFAAEYGDIEMSRNYAMIDSIQVHPKLVNVNGTMVTRPDLYGINVSFVDMTGKNKTVETVTLPEIYPSEKSAQEEAAKLKMVCALANPNMRDRQEQLREAIGAFTEPPKMQIEEWSDQDKINRENLLGEAGKASQDAPKPKLHDKIYIDVPYAERDRVKALGAQWDPAERKWFIPESVPVDKFAQWPQEAINEPDRDDPLGIGVDAQNRTYLAVAYKDRHLAKAAGAKWDNTQMAWYAPAGVDLKSLEQWLPQNTSQSSQTPVASPEEEFKQVLIAAGFVISDNPVMDGRKHRCVVNGDRDGQKSGIYWGYNDSTPNSIPAGHYTNHRTKEKSNWHSTGQILTAEQRAAIRALRAQKVEQRNDEIVSRRNKASARLQYVKQKYWKPVVSENLPAYMQRKEITPKPGVFTQEGQNILIVPIYNIMGEIRTAQFINAEGFKTYVKDGEKEGNFTIVSNELSSEGGIVGAINALGDFPAILITEGYSTASSVNDAMGMPVVAAFDSGNLLHVAKNLREKYPDVPILIAGDNDEHNLHNLMIQENTGLKAAKAAAEAVNGAYVIPMFSGEDRDRYKDRGINGLQELTDWNDMAIKTKNGLENIKQQIGFGIIKANTAVLQAPVKKQAKVQEQKAEKKQEVKRGLRR